MAKTFDKYRLYEHFVQDPQTEIGFFNRMFHRSFGRRPLSFREDFCGTGYSCYEWIKQSSHHTALGIDRDPIPIRYGKENHYRRLSSDQKKRIKFLHRDVLNCSGMKADVTAALNFSYSFFCERHQMLRYFVSVRKSMPKEGIFVLDALGGTEAFEPHEEKRRGLGATYIWECKRYNPIDNTGDFSIHFRTNDGKLKKDVFTYTWRCRSIQEIREFLTEAGFSKSIVYWEGDDGKGGGNGIFRPTENAENCEVWIAYIVALP